MKDFLLIAAVLLIALFPLVRARAMPRRRLALQLSDFKDRRDRHQRHSYGSIAAARQNMVDQQLLEEFNRRVRMNECNRIAKQLVGVPAVSARVETIGR